MNLPKIEYFQDFLNFFFQMLEFFQSYLEFLPVFIEVFHKLGVFSFGFLILYFETMLKFGILLKKIETFWHPFTEKPDFSDLLEFFEEILEFLAKIFLEIFAIPLEYFFRGAKKKAWVSHMQFWKICMGLNEFKNSHL